MKMRYCQYLKRGKKKAERDSLCHRNHTKTCQCEMRGDQREQLDKLTLSLSARANGEIVDTRKAEKVAKETNFIILKNYELKEY